MTVSQSANTKQNASSQDDNTMIKNNTEESDEESVEQFIRKVKAYKWQKLQRYHSQWSMRFHHYAEVSHANKIEETWFEWMGYI